MIQISRRLSQAAFLILFLWLFLQTESKGANELGYPVKIFLVEDPLMMITTLLSSRSFFAPIFLALAVVVATVVLGRVFCGWVCPFGTLHQLAGLLNRKKPSLGWTKKGKPGGSPYRVKYYLLLALLAASLFGLQWAGVFDPISLLIRSLSLAVYPMISYGLRTIFDGLYALNLPLVTPGAEYLYAGLKRTILPFSPPLFLQAVPVGLIFFGLLALNGVEKRFWCKYVCPLGALLGLFSRYAVFSRKVSEGCTGCGAGGQKWLAEGGMSSLRQL
ncbi:MAG: hypothetical protein CSYNP_00712 [Syntrophus sp. SKADARSKE-3]|nr:hypothetical protein [Syntrophus sp. SKADARSKE-3]